MKAEGVCRLVLPGVRTCALFVEGILRARMGGGGDFVCPPLGGGGGIPQHTRVKTIPHDVLIGLREVAWGTPCLQRISVRVLADPPGAPTGPTARRSSVGVTACGAGGFRSAGRPLSCHRGLYPGAYIRRYGPAFPAAAAG